jgi:transcriptional regulator with XRE-family HTH domain
LPGRHTGHVADTDATPALISENLLEARRRLGLTLAEAATLNGVSVTHLSRLERGERQPSIAVLIRLARGYGLPLGQLVGEEAPGAVHVVRGDQAPTREGPDGSYAALSGITGENLLEAIRLEKPEGSRTARGARHRGEEWLLVHAGRIQLEVGPQTFDLGPGDAAHFDAQAPHRLHNIGQGAATVYIVSTSSPTGQHNAHR